MDLSVFFEAIELDQPSNLSTWHAKVPAYFEQFPQWQMADFVLIGLTFLEEKEPFQAANAIRKQLQLLSLPSANIKAVDLGNLKKTASEESYQDVISFVLK